MWFGQSEQNVKQLFERARRQQPAVIFIDEVCRRRDTQHMSTWEGCPWAARPQPARSGGRGRRGVGGKRGRGVGGGIRL
eukprot:365261-Chlamydomonas_euryale.AAC.9